MRRISYLDNIAPRTSPEQRDTAFLNEALNAFWSFISNERQINGYARASSPFRSAGNCLSNYIFHGRMKGPPLRLLRVRIQASELPRGLRSAQLCCPVSLHHSTFLPFSRVNDQPSSNLRLTIYSPRTVGMRTHSSRATLDCMNKPCNEVICVALEWVAFSCQPHNVEELAEALNTTFTLPIDYRQQKNEEQRSWSSEEILGLCADALCVTTSGVVVFRDNNMRNFVLSQDFRPQTRSLPYSGHEMLAITCLHYLQEHDPQIILRPWSDENQRPGARKQAGHVHNYAATFWHVHARVVEANSRYVSAMLHKTILQALSGDRVEDIFYAPKSRDKSNIGLLLCSKYDFKNLGKTYLEMGAEPNHQTSWHDSSLITAITNSCQGMIGLFLAWGADLDVLDQDRSTRFPLACSKRNAQVECAPVKQATLCKAQSGCREMLDCCCHRRHGSQVVSPTHSEHLQAHVVFPNSELKPEQEYSRFKLSQRPMAFLASAKIRHTNSGQQKVACRTLPLRMASSTAQGSRSLISSHDSIAPSRGGGHGITRTMTKVGLPSRPRPVYKSRSRSQELAHADPAEEEDWLIVDKAILAVQP